ncbi:unnamed protein product [Closterium sp. NIES-53]
MRSPLAKSTEGREVKEVLLERLVFNRHILLKGTTPVGGQKAAKRLFDVRLGDLIGRDAEGRGVLKGLATLERELRGRDSAKLAPRAFAVAPESWRKQILSAELPRVGFAEALESDKPLGEAVLKRIKRAYEPNHLSPPSPPLSPHLFHLSGHPWLSHEKQSDKPLGEAVLKRIKNFSAANKMKKLALKVIACNLSREEILGLKKLFKGMDKDGSGSITFAELKTGMQKLGNPMSEEQLQQIMEAADMDHSGTIDYTEFITATMQMNKVEKEEHIWKAFQHFDRDGSGFITVSELRDALANEDMLEVGELEQIIEEVDTDKSGTIDYEEFAAMMRKQDQDVAGAQKQRRTRSIGADYY